MTIALRVLVIAVVFVIAAPHAHAQSAGVAGEIAPGMKGIGLTPAQRRLIYENTSGERRQRVPEDRALSPGAPVPDSLMLNEMPVHVKDEVAVLRDFKFAVLHDAHAVLIVDPANRTIVDVVTRDDAAK